MPDSPSSPEAYLANLPDDRRAMVQAIREVINANLPEGVEEGIQYGMIGWFVPHAVYPDGYHCDPKQPVPYASVANQKNKVSLYLFCAYVQSEVAQSFEEEYRAWLGKKPDMGKSCIRFSKLEQIPLQLIGQTIRQMTTEDFLARYTASIPPSGKKKRS